MFLTLLVDRLSLSIYFLTKTLGYNKDTLNKADAHMQKKGSFSCTEIAHCTSVTLCFWPRISCLDADQVWREHHGTAAHHEAEALAFPQKQPD